MIPLKLRNCRLIAELQSTKKFPGLMFELIEPWTNREVTIGHEDLER